METSAERNARINRHRQALRRQVLAAGGDRCARCGNDDWRVLQLDHTNGGGHGHGVVLKRSRAQVRRLVDMLARGVLQVLCANCNWIKRHENNEHNRRVPPELERAYPR